MAALPRGSGSRWHARKEKRSFSRTFKKNSRFCAKKFSNFRRCAAPASSQPTPDRDSAAPNQHTMGRTRRVCPARPDPRRCRHPPPYPPLPFSPRPSHLTRVPARPPCAAPLVRAEEAQDPRGGDAGRGLRGQEAPMHFRHWKGSSWPCSWNHMTPHCDVCMAAQPKLGLTHDALHTPQGALGKVQQQLVAGDLDPTRARARARGQGDSPRHPQTLRRMHATAA